MLNDKDNNKHSLKGKYVYLSIHLFLLTIKCVEIYTFIYFLCLFFLSSFSVKVHDKRQ